MQVVSSCLCKLGKEKMTKLSAIGLQLMILIVNELLDKMQEDKLLSIK